MSVRLSGTTVNHGTSSSSACYRGKEGSLLSESELLQNPNRDRKSAAAEQFGKVIFIVRYISVCKDSNNL